MHMASDAVVAAGVVVAGGLILWTGWRWLDPANSRVIGAVIVVGKWSLLWDSVNLSLDAVPNCISRHKRAGGKSAHGARVARPACRPRHCHPEPRRRTRGLNGSPR
jgi:Co/Zn/Cd efflux system component